MTTSRHCLVPSSPVLHVFEQDGGWHWGITVPRSQGHGFKVIAFSRETFATEDAARCDGTLALTDSAAAGAQCT